ncbi:MAG TPA: MATE family efflux transporter [Gemmataceae bacterium]|nr:MATE family efflux transporter [Gemmataceae bacterium]
MQTAAGPSGFRLIDRAQPTWYIVLFLALPVLAQQFLILSVGLSDRVLAGRLQPLPKHERSEALGHELMAVGIVGSSLAGGGWSNVLAGEASWETARQIRARHIAYQAAQTMAIYLSWLIAGYTVLVSVGSTALVARFIGAGQHRQAIEVTNQSILLAIVFGLLGTVAGLSGLDGLVWLLQLRGPAAAFAADYLRPLMLLLVFQVIESAGIACLIGAGDTRTGFWVLGGVAVFNLPLAWGCFLGLGPLPELGFVGIAVGTAVSHTLGGLVVLAVLAIGRAGLSLHGRLLWPNADLIWRLLRISLPAGVDSLAIMVGHLWFFSIVNSLGETASSAHGIALGWEALSFVCGNAFGTAAMSLVGQNLGAGRPAQAAHSGWVAFALGCGMMSVMGALFFTFAPEMFQFICPYPEQRPVVKAGVPVLRLEAFAEPALASVIIFLCALRGAGDTRVPVLLNFLGLFGVRVPLAYLLTQGSLGLEMESHWPGGSRLFGAWVAMAADLAVRGCLFLHRYSSGRWQRVQV